MVGAAGCVVIPGYGPMKVVVYALDRKAVPHLMRIVALLYVMREEELGRERAT